MAVVMARKFSPLISAVLLVCLTSILVTARLEGKTHVHNHVVCVFEVEATLSVACQNSVSNCTSLGCVAKIVKEFSNSTKILFFMDDLKLSHHVLFDDLWSVSFTGASNGTTVDCSEAMLTGNSEAGLSFTRIHDLKIVNMTFAHCGAWQNSTTYLNVSSNTSVLLRSSVYILNCMDVKLTRVNITGSPGNGLALFDTSGTVEVKHCRFTDNKKVSNEASGGGGGVYIDFSRCPPGTNTNSSCNNFGSPSTNSRYHFDQCYFIGNQAISLGKGAESTSLHNTGRLFQGMGKGGGLFIHLHDGVFNTFEISDSYFYNNSAVWGGALYLSFHGNSSGNSINVRGSRFIENEALKKAGGGVSMGYSAVDGVSPNNNSIYFEGCEFVLNRAGFGGGTCIYATRSRDADVIVPNHIEFVNCLWVNNTASIGSAVDITPHIWDVLHVGQLITTPVFRDCTFSGNRVLSKYGYTNHSSWFTYRLGKGAFAATDFSVNFSRRIIFNDNDGSSLYLVSTIVYFESGTEASFSHNNGLDGGAISLVGLSCIQISDNSHFNFNNNSAKSKGGAIFFNSIDYHDFISSRSCFLQYYGMHKKPENVTFVFKNNTSGTLREDRSMSSEGNSIYATSIQPCYYACITADEHTHPDMTSTFSCIGNFSYESSNLTLEIGTTTRHFKVGEAPSIIPGKEFKLNFHALNDYDVEIQDVYHAHMRTDNASTIIIEEAYSFIYQERMELYGKPQSKGNLSLYQDSLQGVVVSVEVEIEECPPGYVIRDYDDLPTCVCSYITDIIYMGIIGCDSGYRASLSRGYWMGYDKAVCGGDTFEREECLLSSYCHSSFCFASSRNISHLLPEHANATALDSIVCGPFRIGTLCATCKQRYSVFYHHNNFKCSKNKLCHVGWLFYILSELVPLTILFTLVIVFNVSFTSGAMNGFIFFAQVFDTLDITAHGHIFVSPSALYHLFVALRFVYKFFNLDFFSESQMSFCLWSSASSLDILAFKYVTMAYALTLVLIMIGLMNFAPLYRVITFIKPRMVRKSVTHGLTTFLIMFYAQCAKVTFRILRPTSLYTRNGTVVRTVPLYYGEIGYFSKEHLPYALPAIVCLIFILLIPPLLLLLYPTIYKVLAVFRLNESDRRMKIPKYLSISKLKPVLDSFQSCFGDNTRFFAGLYFVYRLFVPAASVFSLSHSQFYAMISGLLTIMWVCHSVAQPYHVKWHNAVDALIFGDLALINCLTVYNFMKVHGSRKYHEIINTVFSIQIMLGVLPLVYMMGYVIALSVRALHTKYKENKVTIREKDEELPHRLIEDYTHSEQSDYQSFRDDDSGM